MPPASIRPAWRAPPARYSPLQQLLHWMTVLLTAAALPLAWVMSAAPDEKPGVEDLYNLHKTVGVLIFLAIAGRLVLRAGRAAPPLPSSMARADRLLADATHALLYAVFVTMCVSGYVLSAASPYPTLFLDVLPLPALPTNEPLRKLAVQIHRAGQWAVYALVGLHIVGVIFHVAIRRDGLAHRMLPTQREVE